MICFPTHFTFRRIRSIYIYPATYIKKRNVFFLVRFIFCVEDHHSPLESDLTRSFIYNRSPFTFRKRYGSVRIVLFVSISKRTSILKFSYKNSYYMIFIILFVDVDQQRTYLTYHDISYLHTISTINVYRYFIYR